MIEKQTFVPIANSLTEEDFEEYYFNYSDDVVIYIHKDYIKIPMPFSIHHMSFTSYINDQQHIKFYTKDNSFGEYKDSIFLIPYPCQHLIQKDICKECEHFTKDSFFYNKQGIKRIKIFSHIHSVLNNGSNITYILGMHLILNKNELFGLEYNFFTENF